MDMNQREALKARVVRCVSQENMAGRFPTIRDLAWRYVMDIRAMESLLDDIDHMNVNVALRAGKSVEILRLGDRTVEYLDIESVYPMCDRQPVQIDCRVAECVFNTGAGNCINLAPAITLNPGGAFVCWSKKTEKGNEDV